MKKLIFANREWLKYRYYLLSKTFWAKMHGYAATVHDYLLRVYKSTRLKLVMNRPGFPGECFICELRLPDHRF